MLYQVLFGLLLVVCKASAVYQGLADESNSTCLQYWYPYNGNCYRFFDWEVNWSLAESECRLYGRYSHLVSIHDVDENDFVFAFQGGYNDLWLGLNDEAEEGTYVWTDGTPFDYYIWQPDQPDNDCGLLLKCSENCVEMGACSDYNDRWNDKDCDEKRRFVCKQPMS
ncbi:C-type lectin BpLec-like [Glandiceps talaboti]